MSKYYLFLVVIIVSLSVPVNAQFYKYKDANGNILFTDDLSQVPRDQWEKAKQYSDSPADRPKKDEGVAQKPGEKGPDEKPAQTPGDTGMDEEAIRAQLDKRRETLDAEYKGLMDEKEIFEAERKKVIKKRDRRETRKANEQISLLNEKISQYDLRREQYNQEVQAFNDMIEKRRAEQERPAGEQ